MGIEMDIAMDNEMYLPFGKRLQWFFNGLTMG